MDEFALIEKFFANRGVDRADVRLGIGDDAAVTMMEEDYELVIATDSICVGTHFPEDTQPEALGHRCLAVNLSDLAAMGAEPLWCTLVLSLPSAEPDWLAAFANGFFDLAGRFELSQHLARAIGRSVVDDDDLLAKGRVVDTAEDLRDGVALVVDRNDHRQDEVIRREWFTGVQRHEIA